MGQASRAPNLRDTTTVGVTTHALEKLRERLAPSSHFNSMPDADLRLRLEEAWRTASRLDSVEEWWELVDGRPVCNFIVGLEDAFEVDLVGLFRENAPRPGHMVLVTVLTRHMAITKQSSNTWAHTPEKIGNRALLSTPMRDQLSGVTAPAREPIVEVRRPRLSAAAPSAAPVTTDLVLVTWPSGDGDSMRKVSKGEVAQLIEELVRDGVDESKIEFWAKKEAKIRRTIAIDF